MLEKIRNFHQNFHHSFQNEAEWETKLHGFYAELASELKHYELLSFMLLFPPKSCADTIFLKHVLCGFLPLLEIELDSDLVLVHHLDMDDFLPPLPPHLTSLNRLQRTGKISFARSF